MREHFIQEEEKGKCFMAPNKQANVIAMLLSFRSFALIMCYCILEEIVWREKETNIEPSKKKNDAKNVALPSPNWVF